MVTANTSAKEETLTGYGKALDEAADGLAQQWLSEARSGEDRRAHIPLILRGFHLGYIGSELLPLRRPVQYRRLPPCLLLIFRVM